MSAEVARTIERRLRERLRLTRFELQDDSALHAGHRGATSGGGHYTVTIVSEEFEGLGRLARHRLVYDALEGMIGDEIHALAIRAHAPSELGEN